MAERGREGGRYNVCDHTCINQLHCMYAISDEYISFKAIMLDF